jgi:short-subunit dehydrogenase
VDLDDPSALDGLIRALSSTPLDFEILVNNAGFGLHGEFSKTEIEKETQLLNVQLAAMLKLTKVVLPGMMARKNGRILNVASVYSFSPVPFQSVYSACKAFMLSFSESLREELKGTGVTVTTLCPGTTKSEFRARAGISHKDGDAGVPAEVVAKVAVTGALRGKHLIVPGFTNRFFVFMSRHLPMRFVPRLLRSINKARGVND